MFILFMVGIRMPGRITRFYPNPDQAAVPVGSSVLLTFYYFLFLHFYDYFYVDMFKHCFARSFSDENFLVQIYYLVYIFHFQKCSLCSRANSTCYSKFILLPGSHSAPLLSSDWRSLNYFRAEMFLCVGLNSLFKLQKCFYSFIDVPFYVIRELFPRTTPLFEPLKRSSNSESIKISIFLIHLY